MTNVQTVNLAREVLSQWLRDEISDAHAMATLSVVLAPGPCTFKAVGEMVRDAPCYQSSSAS